MLNFIRETFSSTKNPEKTAVNSFETAQKAFDEEKERLRREIADISSKLNDEYKKHSELSLQLSVEGSNDNTNLSDLSNQIEILKEKEKLLLEQVVEKERELGIESAYTEIRDLQEESRINLDAVTIQISCLINDSLNHTEDFRKWREAFGKWLENIYANPANTTPELLATEISTLNNQLQNMPQIESEYNALNYQKNKIDEEYKIIDLEEEQINEYRRQQAQEVQGVLANFIRFWALFFSTLYVLIAGDELGKLSERKETLMQEKVKLDKGIENYEKEISSSRENTRKLSLLKYQLNILKNCQEINAIEFTLSDLKTNPDLIDLLAQKQKITSDIEKAVQIKNSLTSAMDESEQKKLKITLELNKMSTNIRQLEEEKQRLTNSLVRTLNTQEELFRLKQTEETRNIHSKAAEAFASGDLDRQDEVSSDAGDSVKSATTFESVSSSESLVENPKYQKRFLFFNDRADNSEANYYHLLNRKIKNYSETPALIPFDNMSLHVDQLNKSYMAMTNIGIKIGTLITKLGNEARAAQSVSSETTKYNEEISLFKQLQDAINNYNIFVSLPSPNLDLIEEKCEAIKSILANIKNKIDDSYPFLMQIEASGISLKTINNAILIAQKTVVSHEIEKHLQQITSHLKQTADKKTRKKYNDLKTEVEKYQSLILIPTPDASKLSEYQQNARESLENIKKLHEKLGLNIAPLENSLNAGRKIIGIYDEPNPSANIGFRS